jgi:hypothetical protein
MRGKLRDKRAPKRDIFKREGTERRRPGKRDNRGTTRLNLPLEGDEYDDDIEEEEEEEREQQQPNKIPNKK